ncbi:MAG: EAL domain-containing protein [Blastocatellia bacterium]|nr:EAL domain-containing protein [Blastocatellia bacterium]
MDKQSFDDTTRPARAYSQSILPNGGKQDGRLFLWPANGRCTHKIIRYLEQNCYPHRLVANPDCLVVSLSGHEIERFANGVEKWVTTDEAKSSRVLFVAGDSEPGFQDFPRVTSLYQFIMICQSNWLWDLLDDQRLTSFFQPIFYAHNPARVYAQEALLRGFDRDGTMVNPSQIFRIARGAGMVSQVDLAARHSAIAQAARHKVRTPVFINFPPTAIFDPAHCFRATVQAIEAVGMTPRDVVFEVTELDHTENTQYLQGVLNFYRSAGFRIAIDDLGSGYSSLNLIHQLRPDIVKLDMELTRNVHADSYKGLLTRKILEITQELNIMTVSEGIETEEEYRWLREHGTMFVQGYYFAKPSAEPLTGHRTPTELAPTHQSA